MMMKKNNCSIYLRNLKRLMPVYGKNQRIYLHTINESLNDYCNSNPNPSYEELEDNFGTPVEIIGDYLREQETQTLIKQVNQRNFFRLIIGIVLLAALICCSAFWVNYYRAYLHSIQTEPVYIIESPIYIDNITTEQE
jgi:hypothetical protein